MKKVVYWIMESNDGGNTWVVVKVDEFTPPEKLVPRLCWELENRLCDPAIYGVD